MCQLFLKIYKIFFLNGNNISNIALILINSILISLYFIIKIVYPKKIIIFGKKLALLLPYTEKDSKGGCI